MSKAKVNQPTPYPTALESALIQLRGTRKAIAQLEKKASVLSARIAQLQTRNGLQFTIKADLPQ